ncbi:anthocyanidin 3-O-glucosyltransferase 2-like [Phragmites australis]|uniref:anthocyanidin 3-O-glucosyltransferase 2-like n=1 Tax=Phragmites australis TaxID=29695 RepID=UPI002D7666F5|nr:anthocyanidin 3-O-glucosyltransferase 2-like [Phragmites australis]
MAAATIVFLPCWGSGHFMSMIEAGKRMLASSGGALSLTVLVMQAPSAAKASEVEDHVRREAASGLDIRFLRLPAIEPPTDCKAPEEFNFRYIQLHAPHVAEAIAGLASPVAAIVVDLFCTPLLDVARKLAVPRYVYFASTGAFLALMLCLPTLREQLTVSFREMEGTVHVPGLPPVPSSYMPACLASKKTNNIQCFEYYGRRFMDASGIIVNSSVELERGVLTAIADGRCVLGRPAPVVHAIGPVIWFGAREEPHECVQWLHSQPSASVVFLCFGSIGFLDRAQVEEIAAGLERSGHRFLWVLRGPPAAGSSYPTDADLDATLPSGFLKRTEGRGLVWPSWSPQKEVLAHPAVGGFVTHCGWNSVLESLWFGVPMVPWPLYGEQHLNAFELIADMGVAVQLKKMDRSKEDFFVEAAELEQAVRGLMGETAKGSKAREKALEMKATCRKAVAEGGSSYAALRKLVLEISPGGEGPSP